MRCLLVNLACFTLALAAAFAESPKQSVIVVLRFEGDHVTFVSKSVEEGGTAPQRGTPELERMFYEVRGKDGEVIYADVIVDPRSPAQEGVDAKTGKMVGGATKLSSAETTLRFPSFPDAKTFTAYRRKESDGDDEGDREVLVEVSL